MTPKSRAWALAIIVLVATSSRADDPITLTPATIELTSTPCGDGWKRWDGIGNVEGAVAYRERLTALAAHENDVWVGTSAGRLLSRQDNQWTLQGTLQGIQITGIAFEGSDKVWLSTSDGIRRLDRADERTWKVSEYREYYEGHPSFVSGAYIPGEDAVRLWGYVDDIYIPRQETAYSPFAISHRTRSLLLGRLRWRLAPLHAPLLGSQFRLAGHERLAPSPPSNLHGRRQRRPSLDRDTVGWTSFVSTLTPANTTPAIPTTTRRTEPSSVTSVPPKSAVSSTRWWISPPLLTMESGQC